MAWITDIRSDLSAMRPSLPVTSRRWPTMRSVRSHGSCWYPFSSRCRNRKRDTETVRLLRQAVGELFACGSTRTRYARQLALLGSSRPDGGAVGDSPPADPGRTAEGVHVGSVEVEAGHEVFPLDASGESVHSCGCSEVLYRCRLESRQSRLGAATAREHPPDRLRYRPHGQRHHVARKVLFTSAAFPGIRRGRRSNGRARLLPAG